MGKRDKDLDGDVTKATFIGKAHRKYCSLSTDLHPLNQLRDPPEEMVL